MIWIEPKDKNLPRGEKPILIKHAYGIDYINFNSGAFRYCYSGVEIPKTIMNNIISWGDPSK